MAAQFSYIRAVSRWRVEYGVTAAGLTCLDTPVVARGDNGPYDGVVSQIVQIDSSTFQAVLTAPLISGFSYTLSMCGDTQPFKFDTPQTDQATNMVIPVDPEASAFGVDIDWLAEGLTQGGDLPLVQGRDALIFDLASITQITPGELVHRPTDGVGAGKMVNGPNTFAGDLRAAIKRQWLSDARVKDSSVTVVTNSDGTVDVDGIVKTIALPDVPVLVKV